MKTKSRPLKRKSIGDSSMESVGKDTAKKPCARFRRTLSNINNPFSNDSSIQLSAPENTSVKNHDYKSYASANADSGINKFDPVGVDNYRNQKHLEKEHVIDKVDGTNVGVRMGNTIAKAIALSEDFPTECDKRGDLPIQCHKQGNGSLQITGANVDIIDPYRLQMDEILEMIYENKHPQRRQLSKDEAESSCSNNEDTAATICTTNHMSHAPTSNDKHKCLRIRQRPKIHNSESNYLHYRRKMKWRNRHRNNPYLDPIGTQYLGQESISASNRIPVQYNYLGQCTCVCRHCGAMFWECEKLASASHTSQFAYNKCCYGGRVVLRPPPEYPQYIKQLYENAHFMDNIRAYNQMFSMTSLGANVDKSINNGRGPYVFRISGQLYHWIGSLCPEEGQSPRFLQLYIYDTTNEVKNRLSHFSDEHQAELKEEIVEGLIEFLDKHNALVQLFWTARNKHMDADIPEFKVRLYNVIGTRHYELPTSETIGAIVFADSSAIENEFDLIIEEHSRFPQRVSKLHPCYMSLQFPLLFVYGEDGYQRDMKLANITGQSTKSDKRMTMNMYYSYQIHSRLNQYNLLHRGGKLFQQYVVTAYCAIEQSRLDYIRQKQDDIRSEYLSGIYDAILRGDRDGSDLGLRTVLTASFTGSPRYMYAHYLNALVICRVHGSPAFFITFTCNIKWPKIEEFMMAFTQLTVTDRADIIDRVFEKKVRDYIDFVRDSNTFGTVVGVLYTIEFQKRGLPHCHSLLWIDGDSKVQQDIDVDKYICAELPDPAIDPNTYVVISELMIHGPCGSANPIATCMKDGGTCNRNFPKPYCNKTYIDKEGFVHYRRRDTEIQVQRQHVWLDNRRYADGRHLTYLNFPSEYAWYATDKYWQRRRHLSKPSIGRLIYVHPSAGDLFYQRTLLCHQKGCTSFADIRKINNNIYPTNKAACQALGLLSGDQEWVTALQEASVFATASELRRLFVYILIFYEISDPLQLWNKVWKTLSDDIPRKLSKSLRIPQIQSDEKKLKTSILFELEHMLNSYSKSLKDFDLPMPPADMLLILQNRLLMEETNYDPDILAEEKKNLIPRLNKNQRLIFDEITYAVRCNVQKLIFVYGHGGTGKTFLWKAITSALRSEEKIILTVAASGIAALLLPSGRTAHSRFQIPLNLEDR
ncbi:DNA helicase [Tanacetum coccineum]|uniref:ATP-dependent DNA helicase n=1 Tax=Tanacetum coccineum TaxID=301880 RepID=A0ABQ4ZRH5_9ASTR